MSILTVFNIDTMTAEKYEQVLKDLEAAGAGTPPGRLYHVSTFPEGGSAIITDVWESAESLDEFGKTLTPILENNGVTPVEPKVYPVHNVID